MIYIIQIVFSLLWGTVCFAYDGTCDFRRNRKIFLFGFFSVCAFIMGLRDVNVGVDTFSYGIIFIDVSNADWSSILSGFYFSHMEIGYAIFMKVCSMIFDNYIFFNMAEAVIYSCLAAKFINDNCDNVFVGAILFLGLGTFLLMFNIRRQMMCALLLANCWTMLLHRCYWKSIVYFVFAFCSHTSGFIFVLGYFAYFFRKYEKIFWVVPILALVSWYSFETYLYLFAEYFDKYGNYYANSRTLMEAYTVIITWIIIAIISLYALYRGKDDYEFRVSGAFAMTWLCFLFIGLKFNYVERVGLNFLPFVILLYEKFGYRIPWRSLRCVYYCGLVACYLAYYYLSFTTVQYVYEFAI